MYPEPHIQASWNNRLAFDLALVLEGSGLALDELFEAHHISQDDLLVFNKDPIFLKTVQQYRDEIKEKGLSFRLKARAQAEELLTTSWQIIHDTDTSPAVKADLIKWTAKVANLEPKPTDNTVETGGGVRITINLNSPTQENSFPGLKVIDGTSSSQS